MITKEESEKLFLYCLEELRLIIEHPYENHIGRKVNDD